MAFHEIQFPNDIAYGATGGPEFATSVVATASGYEQRNINWSAARGRWDVASGLKKQTQLDTLIAFFRARKGRAHGFRFKDWTDYKATGQALGTGNGTTTPRPAVAAVAACPPLTVRVFCKLGASGSTPANTSAFVIWTSLYGCWPFS
jgi:hypothetical protein